MTASPESEDARIETVQTEIADADTRPASEAGAVQVSPTEQAPAKKTSASKTPAKQTAGDQPATKEPAVKKPAVTKTAAKKSPAKKPVADSDPKATAAAKQAAASNAAAKTTAAKTAAATAAKRTAAVKKAATTTAAAKSAAKEAAAKDAAAKTAAAKSTAAKTADAKSTATKTTAKKSPAKKASTRTTTTKKAPAARAAAAAAPVIDTLPAPVQSSPAETSPAEKAPVRGTPAKKAAAKTAPAGTAAAAKAPARTTGGRAATPARKASVKKAPAKTVAVAAVPAASEVATPILTADVVIDLEAAPSARRLVAASHSAPEAAEARQPRETAPTGTAAQADPLVAQADPLVAQTDPLVAQTDTVAPQGDTLADQPTPAFDPESAPSASDTAPTGITDAIRIRGLVKRFGDTTAVDGIDLTVPAGSFYGLVGPNGAGKTTTLSIISGLLRPDVGSVHISGIDQRTRPLDAKRVMGVLPDRLRTFDRLTGRQLLFYYGQLRGLKRAVIESRTADLARAFDLTDALSRVVSDYSAGMTKKLMLAGALIHSPRVLVLDEPFEAVDPVSSGVILDILRAYVSHGGTVILSSHGMDLVERVCSRVAVIVGGEVLAEGTVDEVRAGRSLSQRFVELSGSGGEVEGLEWLHTFSD
ncbi:ATP-binding cassette domain-containing protein [Microbacterium sp. Mu-80]|uniref:ATP-binding cassette domain-containing protein n=1 Tax=Microbacterium bandirmense TaxID=3122050 RepID=A0ABU8LAJ6_9MICO